MTIAQTILEQYTNLSEAQKEIIGHVEGPLLVIAGPGSGKTYTIILRALNLLLLRKAQPKQLVLCTYTEKAAFEMRDRLMAAAKKVGFKADLSEISISTIHSLCNRILIDYRHKTELGQGFETLDELTQLLFIFEHFDEIIGKPKNDLFLEKWKTRWTTIEGVRVYFDKITEELVDVSRLKKDGTPFNREIGKAYSAYKAALLKANRIDFAHLQRFVFELLQEQNCFETITERIKYVLVDEYQDTNYIQEQLLLKLTEKDHNICVVGDEDQSLYRFRGATVRNILEFPQRVPGCRLLKLTTNYRSHRDIVKLYDKWMASADWSNANGPSFRFDKTISASNDIVHPEYPAVIAIWGENQLNETARLANFVEYLMKNEVILDYSQVALLLHSVREDYSGPYLRALQDKGIPAYCPRARAYFEIPEVKDLVACFALIFGWYGESRGRTSGSVEKLATYVDDAIISLGKRFVQSNPIVKKLKFWSDEITNLETGKTLDFRPADYLFKLLAIEPFRSAIKNENTARNIAIFSQLLNVFQSYYHYSVITYKNREFLRLHLFSSFLHLLYDGGINEYEDKDRPFPTGLVQVMTIHQAKGLEFPVVIVGSLSNQISSPKQTDRDLGPYYHRALFEPEDKITGFDRMRLHYVAFSRPQKILLLTAHEAPKEYFKPIWQGLPQWPYVDKGQLAAQHFELQERMQIKKTYSFTGDLKIYETCPRQYQFFRDYNFTPSRSAVIFFGLLVHQTIEEIHRIAMDGKISELNDKRIREIFDRTFQFLTLSDVRPIGEASKEAAYLQVLNYFKQNSQEMQRIIQTEVDVSLEKDGYILTGKVDLLLGGDGKLELLDFKTSPRPKNNPELIASYEQQLCTYAHILEHRHNRKVDRLMLYWTSESKKETALMVLPYDSSKVDEAGRHFDETVQRIQEKNFAVRKVPEPGICRECDLRQLCKEEDIIAIND